MSQAVEDEIRALFRLDVRNVLLSPDEPRRVDKYVQEGIGATLKAPIIITRLIVIISAICIVIISSATDLLAAAPLLAARWPQPQGAAKNCSRGGCGLVSPSHSPSKTGPEPQALGPQGRARGFLEPIVTTCTRALKLCHNAVRTARL